jgi:hypothetical protein
MPILDLTGRKSAEELEKLPTPSNANLKLLFQNTDRILIKDGGVHNNQAVGNKIRLIISEDDKIAKFCEFLELNEQTIGFYCMCLGTYAIELHSGNEIPATIGFHHGISIRYDGWNSDVELAKSEELLHFLFDLGFQEPLQERINESKRYEKQKNEDEKWLSNAPKCFAKYWNEMNDFDDDYLSSLLDDFNAEIPERDLQIISLLKIFSVSQNLWTAYPIYEKVPETILTNYSLQEILLAYNNSEKSRRTQIGLGRFLCSFRFRKDRKKQIKLIPQSVIDEIRQVFTATNQKEGLQKIEKLQKEKDKNQK